MIRNVSMPFPESTVLELERDQMESIEMAVLKERWRLDNVVRLNLATKDDEDELSNLNELADKLFKIRFELSMRKMGERYETQ